MDDLHLQHAINLDGGSSSVLVNADGHIVNHPTCLDVVSYKCERPVATVFCMGSGGGDSGSDSSLSIL